LTGGAFAVVVAGALLLSKLYIDRQIRKAEEILLQQLEKLTKGEPCEVATILGAVGTLIGRQAGTSAKAALLADLSHAKRDANIAGEEALVEQVGQMNPSIGGILAGMGRNQRKGLLKNPLVGLAIQGFLGGGFSPGGNHSKESGPNALDRKTSM
jgi:hypothetical protein